MHEAKAKLSEILRKVKRGRSVVIAERGRAIARVVPIEPPATLVDQLVRLTEEGAIVVRRGRRAAVRPLVRRRGALKRFLESRV